MDSPYPAPNQVGAYFVSQFYHVLETNPGRVYQFYSDDSIMLRIDGNTRDTATSLLQIHQLTTSLSYTGIEIKAAHSLKSLYGGVLIMVYGSLVKEYGLRRQFVQTFFLAPKEKGFFVLNDILQFVEEEPVHLPQPVFLAQSNHVLELNAPSTIDEPVSNYLLGGDIQERYIVATNEVNGNGAVDNNRLSMQQMQQVHDSERILEEVAAEESYGSLQPTINAIQNHVPSAEEPPEEPQKHTYASILRAKGQTTPSVVSHPSEKSVSSLEWDHVPPTNSQQTTTSTNAFERSEADLVEEVPTTKDEVRYDIKSVYVRNLSSTVTASQIEEEFRKFGRIRPGGIIIRSRQDVAICYAFIEFEDAAGVRNAIKAGSVEVKGREAYIEERRLNNNISSRGGRGRGRGRSSYHSEAPRGRFGARSSGRGSGQDGRERDYTKSKGNGIYRPTTRQERGY